MKSTIIHGFLWLIHRSIIQYPISIVPLKSPWELRRLSQLIRATDEDGSALSTKEIVDNVFTLVFAGIATCLHQSHWPFYTLPKTNMAPENGPSQKETSIPTIHFQVLC